MTRRTKIAYVGGLKFAHENLIELNGCGIIIDFESAMRAALKIVVPNLQVYGCWFHFVQALRRKLASMNELNDLVRTNKDAKSIFRKFQCLALLPVDTIFRAYVWLLREALNVHKLPEFSPFIDYFKNQWLNRVKPENFSVFMKPTRTTGAAEASNGKANKIFRTHGNFFNFVETLQNEEAVKSDQFDRDVSGSMQHDKRKRFYKERSHLINKYSKQLLENKVSYKQFLNIMAKVENEILFPENAISLHPKDIEMTNETELMFGNDISIEGKCVRICCFELLHKNTSFFAIKVPKH